MMTGGGEGSDRSVGLDAGPARPDFEVAKAFRRPFRLSQPTTWPNWFWWLVTVLWCAIVALFGAWLTVAVNPGYGFGRMFVTTFACAVIVNVAVMVWNAYQKRQKRRRAES